MGTRSWGWAVSVAARQLRERLALFGSDLPKDGVTATADTADLIAALAQKERHAFGAQFAEAAVDVTTGEVRVRRMLGVFAVAGSSTPSPHAVSWWAA